MNEYEWKELKIDDLPSDLFYTDYEFSPASLVTYSERTQMIYDWVLFKVVKGKVVLYRKRQPDNIHPDVLPYIDERLKLIGLEESDKTISWWKGYQEALLSIREWVLNQSENTIKECNNDSQTNDNTI